MCYLWEGSYLRDSSKFLWCSCCLSTETAKALSMATSDKLQIHHTDVPRTPSHLTPDTPWLHAVPQRHLLQSLTKPFAHSPKQPSFSLGPLLESPENLLCPLVATPQAIVLEIFCLPPWPVCYPVKEDPSLEQPILQSNLSG